MDPIIQSNLVALRIEEILRERQSRHDAGTPWYGGPSPSAMTQSAPRRRPLRLPLRLRRHLAAVLIQAGRRLGDTARPRDYPLYGSAHR